ncbi:MAG: recombinase family protein [Desulfomonilaceae bacterium]|jgi:site-specific DNA recombinase
MLSREVIAMKKAAIYARVSTDEQKKHGISLDAQVARCEQYAKDNGYEVVHTGIESISGKDTEHRPILQNILEMANKRRINHLLVVKLDRLSRDTEDSLRIGKMLAKKHVGLHLVTEGGEVDLSDPNQEAMFTMRAMMGRFERRRISLNTKFALARKRDLGQRISRHAPYGYRFKGDKLVINSHEQGVIKRIQELNADGYSLRSIEQTLYQEGLLNRCNKRIAATQIWRVLRAA